MKYIPLTFNQVWANGLDGQGVFFLNQYGPMYGDYEGKYSYNNDIITLGGVRYYTSPTCGYLKPGDINSIIESACKNNYDDSDIRFLLENYMKQELQEDDLKKVNNYKIRLITKEELENNLFYVENKNSTKTPNWVYEGGSYWTMTRVENSDNLVYINDYSFGIVEVTVYGGTFINRYGYARPVINLLKSAIK